MIDLILFSFVVGIYAGGFWCGKKFGTAQAMWSAVKAKF
jgi:hypothetical protein